MTKYIWIDADANSGPVIVIGKDCRARSGQIAGSCASSQFVHGHNPRNYHVVDGVFTPKAQALIDIRAKEAAYLQKTTELEAEKDRRNNSAPFMHDNVKYVNDEANFQGVKIHIVDKVGSDPLPTFIGTPVEGCWKTFDGSYTAFTNSQFVDGLCNTYFFMRSHNFTNHGLLQGALNTLYEDEASTADTINIFDILAGWSPITAD